MHEQLASAPPIHKGLYAPLTAEKSQLPVYVAILVAGNPAIEMKGLTIILKTVYERLRL